MKGTHSEPRPAEAIKDLETALKDPRVEYKRAYVSTDLTELRMAFPDDASFAKAVLAVVREIKVALGDPAKYGKPLSRKLKGLRRGAFTPLDSRHACLRLVAEPVKHGGIRIYAFRHRHQPPGPYIVAGDRALRRR